MIRQVVFAAIAAFALAASATAADLTFRGEVIYSEAAGLPIDAQLWVSLVSLPDGATIASAAAPVVSSARPPLSYTLDVRSKTVEQGGSFGLLAQIRSGQRVVFRSPQPIAIDLAASQPTQLIVVYAPDPAPAHTPAPAPSLLDTLWTVTSISGTPVLPATKVTFAIAADYRAGGHSGCNNYFTEASFEEKPLRFGPVAGTKMACAPDVMAQESALFAALDAVADYRQAGGTLQLLDAAGVPLIGLVPSP